MTHTRSAVSGPPRPPHQPRFRSGALAAGSTSYSNWQAAEPNGGSDGNCVVLGRYMGGGWNDAPCSNAARYICELN